MATEKWVGGSGVGLTWTDTHTTASLNTFTSGNALAGSAIDNSSALDMFMDISVALASFTPAAPGYIGVFIYPLNEDGTTYGDGRFGSSVTGPPPTSYWVGNIPVVTGGAAVQEGTIRGVIMPPGSFKVVLYNNCGANWAASGNTSKYRTYNRSIA